MTEAILQVSLPVPQGAALKAYLQRVLPAKFYASTGDAVENCAVPAKKYKILLVKVH